MTYLAIMFVKIQYQSGYLDELLSSFKQQCEIIMMPTALTILIFQ